jgi:aspartate-semialdehyde dehydrogenase
VSPRPLRLALLGATGAVGGAVLEALQDRDFPVAALRPLASGRSAGSEVEFRGEGLRVDEVGAGAFRGSDLALLAAPAEVARIWGPAARAEGCLVADASDAFAADPEVPVIVPEVNPGAAGRLPKGMARSAGGLVPALALALKPILEAAGVTHVAVVSLESASGAGRRGLAQLEAEAQALMSGREPDPPAAVPHRLAFNLVPQIGPFAADGATSAEVLLRADLGALLPGVAVAATAVRVPVFYAHAAAVRFSTVRPLSADEAREILKKAAGVKLVDRPAEQLYPMPMLSVNDDAVLVGRIRGDPTAPNGLELFLSVDNLRKGGATNLVQVARLLAARHLQAH